MSDKRKSTIEVYAPVKGIITDTPRNIMDPRSQPTGTNGNLYYGINQKEFGTSLWNTGTVPAVSTVMLLRELQYTNGRSLQYLTSTAMYKYSSTADVFVLDCPTATSYTGTSGDYWSAVMYEEKFIYTNGKDKIQYKAGLASTGTDMPSALSPSTLLAWGIQGLKEHLCLYHVFDNGTEYPKRIQWTKKSPLTYSAATTDFGSGTAGAIDLPDVEGEIQCAVPLSGNVAVFADESIHTQTYIGGDEIYRFEKSVSGIGTPSRRGAVSNDNVAYVMGYNNMYSYHGGDDLRPIGDAVRRTVFSEINPAAKEHCWVEYDKVYDRVFFHIPTGTSTQCDTTWVYYVKDQAWSRLRRSYASATEYSQKDSVTIGQLVGNIGAQNLTFGAYEALLSARVRLWGDYSGFVVKHDPTRFSITVSGTQTAQPFVYETPDFTGTKQKDPNGSQVDFTTTKQRWLNATIWACGEGTLLAEVSTDGGRSYAALPQSPQTLVASGSSHSFSVQKRSPQCSVRLSNTGTNEFVGIEYAIVEFIPGSENA